MLRTAFGVPSEPIEVRGELYRDCVTFEPGGSLWSAEHYILATLDPADGTLIRVDGTLPGQLRAISAHPRGGIVVALVLPDHPETVELCGRSVGRSEGPAGPLDVLIAHIR